MILDCIRGLYLWRRVHQVRQLPPDMQSPSTTQSLPVVESPPTTHSLPVVKSPPTIPIFSCPEEIILLILDHVPEKSLAAFALTCWGFNVLICGPREQVPRRRFALNEEERFLLLGWIEKDKPNLYVCYRCKFVHLWNRGQGPKRYNEHCGAKKEYERDNGVVSFTAGRLALNRHLYGKLHGPPLQDFNYTKQIDLDRGVVQKRYWSARIIGDELYFKVTTQLYHANGVARNLREQMETQKSFTYRLVCEHVPLAGPARREHRIHELDQPQPLVAGKEFAPVTGPLRSCPRCFTDFCIDVKHGPLPTGSKTKKSWIITITGWHQLGKFRLRGALPTQGQWCVRSLEKVGPEPRPGTAT